MLLLIKHSVKLDEIKRIKWITLWKMIISVKKIGLPPKFQRNWPGKKGLTAWMDKRKPII